MSEASWFLSGGADSSRVPRIFCFPYAGGNPRAFLDWQPSMGDDAEIVAVCMPGRGHRIAEQPPSSIADLADGAAAAISTCADRPIYLFGHSLGALVAFEVARRLGHLPSFRHLVASGCAAPAVLPSQRVVRAAQLEGRAFAEAVDFFGGLRPEIIADEEVRDLLLPGLQADFRLVAGYRYHVAGPLAVDVSLINGRDDPHVGITALRRWRQECRRAPDCHWVDGGHFHFEPHPHAVLDLLRSLVLGDTSSAADVEQHVELI